jgi:simple sugar transport system permease protein
VTVLAPARTSVRDLFQVAGAFALGVTLLAIFLAVAGFHVVAALGALWDGAFGSWYNFTSAALVRATPLVILGLAFTLASKAGAINVGMEGQFAAGAIGATWAGLHVGGMPPVLAITVVLALGLIGGAIWVTLPVILRMRFGVSEVISTLLLNFVAVAAVSYLVTGPLQEPSRVYPQSSPIAITARLPHLAPGSRLHIGFLFAIVITALLSLLLTMTSWGFRIRAVGAGPRAALISGRMPVATIVAAALLWSGALAGFGGAVEVTGVSYALYQNLSPGYGFTAIAVALLGRLQPPLVLVAGLLFGALEAGAAAMQRDAGIPAVAVQVVEAVVIIVMLVSARRRA